MSLQRGFNIEKIDINFDVYSDTPKGKDPDSYSLTLKKYHQIIWSKPLPNNKKLIEIYTQKIQEIINKVWGEY